MPFDVSFTFGLGSSFQFSFHIAAGPTPKPKKREDQVSDEAKRFKAALASKAVRPTNLANRNTHTQKEKTSSSSKSLKYDHEEEKTSSSSKSLKYDHEEEKTSSSSKSLKHDDEEDTSAHELATSPLLEPAHENTNFRFNFDEKTSKDKLWAVSNCPLFTTFSAEIRQMIYSDLLVLPEPIAHAHKLLGFQSTAMLEHYKPIAGIDAAITRTCRFIHEEANPILYGHNEFEFQSAEAVNHFGTEGLTATYPPTFQFQPAPFGRLTILRTVTLKFQADEFWNQPIGNGQQPQPPGRSYTWRAWATHFFAEGLPSDRIKWGFPALESLTLDFTDWVLADSEGLLARPFVRKFGHTTKLRKLVVKGLKHASTLEKLKKGIVETGGVFTVINT